eukprot:390966_1
MSLYIIIAINILLRPFSAGEFELILTNQARSYFTSALLTSGIENPVNPRANTYSIIGTFDSTTREKYKNINNKYQFKLVYKYSYQDDDTLEWKQSSWLTDTTIVGADLFNIPSEKDTLLDEQKFSGLGLNNGPFQAYSYLEGNAGKYSNNFHNAVGETMAMDGGIPAFNGENAEISTLYIWKPTEGAVPAEANGKTFTMDCNGILDGKVIQVTAATYGANCDNVQINNALDNVQQMCNGLQICNYFITVSVLNDPAVGCDKTFVYEYECVNKYATINIQSSLANANQECMNKYGTNAISIHDKVSFDYAYSLCEQLIPNYVPAGIICCLGGSNVNSLGEWAWLDGTDGLDILTPNYPNGLWAVGEPQGSVDEDYACVAVWDGTWNKGIHDCIYRDPCYPICDASCLSIDGGGWKLVRHSYNKWYAATDNLAGTDEYGTPDDNPQSTEDWSVQFSSNLRSDGQTEFMFSNG